jgi:hypothetical protein
VAQAARLGSTVKSRALHSATHASRFESHPAPRVHAAQPLAVCALTRVGDRHPINNKISTNGLNDASRTGLAIPGEDASEAQCRPADAVMRLSAGGKYLWSQFWIDRPTFCRIPR